MGPQGAVNILYRREIETAADPEKRRAELVREYTDKFANPLVAAERGLRRRDHPAARDPPPGDHRAAALAVNKRDWMPPKKHGNIPL